MEELDIMQETQEFVPDTQPIVVQETTPDSVDSVQVRERVQELRDQIDNDYKELCKLLWVVSKKSLYESWGFANFKEYVQTEVVFKITKAMYLVQIWEHLYERQMDKSIFDKVMTVGWTKAKELVHVVTKENVDEWVEKARHVTVESLIKEVKAHLSKMIPDDPAEATAKADSGEVDNTPAAESTKHINFAFKVGDYFTVSKAIDRVKNSAPGITNGAALAAACQDFLGSNPEKDTGPEFAVEVLQKYESLFGLKLVIFSAETRDCLHGFDYLKTLTQEANT